MKKILIIVVLLLVLGGGGGAAYYFFFMNQESSEVTEIEPKTETAQQEVADKPRPIMDLTQPKEQTRYFVAERKVAVVDQPDIDGLTKGYLYKGGEIDILERQGDWARISDYIVLEEGAEEKAEWISMKGLVTDEVIISKEEQLEILDSYLVKSDDLKLYQAQFRKAVARLIENGECSPMDFEELGGWVKSHKYSSRNVYFIYCGGMNLDNKIYLDVDKNEVFIL